MPLKVGVPREVTEGERRVALTPDVAASLIKKGCQIVVERGAGSTASFVAGAYEDNSIDATWAMGDWNCDGKFDSSDLVLAFKLGGYTTGAATA